MSIRNTNTKHGYFYTDPLAAAWMAKHFGMRFQYAEYALSDLETPTGFKDFDQGHDNTGYWDLDVNDAYPRYFIHPDSLHLLEPLHGDILLQDGSAFVWGPFNGQNVKSAHILQRDGKRFMWPEREAM